MTVACWFLRDSRAFCARSYLYLPKSMSLATGGLACGATSTRSRSDSSASRLASSIRTIPTCSPFGPTRRTSGTRMRSLMRVSELMGPPSSEFDVVRKFSTWRPHTTSADPLSDRCRHRPAARSEPGHLTAAIQVGAGLHLWPPIARELVARGRVPDVDFNAADQPENSSNRPDPRELSEIPSIEVISRAGLMLLSAAAERLGLSADDPESSPHR